MSSFSIIISGESLIFFYLYLIQMTATLLPSTVLQGRRGILFTRVLAYPRATAEHQAEPHTQQIHSMSRINRRAGMSAGWPREAQCKAVVGRASGARLLGF